MWVLGGNSLLLSPDKARDAFNAQLQLLHRGRVGKANVLSCLVLAKINAGRYRHTGFLQQISRKSITVLRKAAAIGIQVPKYRIRAPSRRATENRGGA